MKKYGFLVVITGLAMTYGVVHDVITYHLSPDYYVLGKGIESAANGFNGDVARLALKTTWSVGLLGGAAYLMANHPGRHPQLP